MNGMDVGRIARTLTDLEDHLDPSRPEVSGLTVLAYGEISATLRLPGPQFTDRVAKRMSGFPDDESAQRYCDLVARYCAVLRDGGLSVLATDPVIVPRIRRRPVVYLIQPLVPAAALGNQLMHGASDAGLADLVRLALEQVDRARAIGTAGLEVAIDAQLSNFSFADDRPTLIDVGTPFMRLQGRHLLDVRVMLAAVPPGIRQVYIRRRIGERYMDDYFDRRLVAVDLLGNFIKEGCGDRIGIGIAAANAWLGDDATITESEVRHYYEKDAGTLALFLRVRRADRWVRTALLRQSYDFVLPGTVRR